MNEGLPVAERKPRHCTRSVNFRPWLGIVLSIVCLVWLICTMDWAGVWMAMTQVNYWLVAAALLLNLASVLLRTARWRLMFRQHHVPSFGRLIVALLIGQAINVIAPARLGDLARAALVDAGGTVYTLGTLAVEKALDLLMLAMPVVLLLSQAALPVWWRESGYVLVATSALALVAVAVLVVGRRWVARLLEQLAARWRHPTVQRALNLAGQFLLSLDILGRPTQLLPALAWSTLIWLLYGTVNYILLGAVGERPSVLAALFLLVVLQLGIAVPSSPGRIGVFHYLCVQALTVFGVNGPKAFSYAVILHLISVGVPMAIGSALAWRLGVSLWGKVES